MEKKPAKISDLLMPLIILWAIIHYFAAGYLAPMSYQACKSPQAAYNTAFCSCAKTKLRASPYLELFIYGAMTDNDKIGKQIAQGIFNIKQKCKVGAG